MKTVTVALGVDAALGLANSYHGPGAHYRRWAAAGEPPHDHLDTPERASEFLGTHSVPVPVGPPSINELARLRDQRALARALVGLASGDLPTWLRKLDEQLGGVAYRLSAEGILRPVRDGWDGVADALLPAIRSLADEQSRLTVCGNPKCRWLFIDRSPNRSRVWCEMAVCGNRMKVGRHRHRQAIRGRRSAAPARQ
jgi:predicted RNA-binding Zn ribbon-like protein